MDAWGEALLSQCSHHPGGEQEGPEERWAYTERASQDEAGTKAPEGQWTVEWANLMQVESSWNLRH